MASYIHWSRRRKPSFLPSGVFSCFRPIVRLDSQAIRGSPSVGLILGLRMFFAAFTSASKMLRQLVQRKRHLMMRLAASRCRCRSASQWPGHDQEDRMAMHSAIFRRKASSRGGARALSGQRSRTAGRDGVT